MTQPIVIVGGFLSFSMLYIGMRDTLAEISGQPVWIVEMQSYDWLPATVPPGWNRLLRKLEKTVHEVAAGSDTGKVTLIGHSAGGVLARLYLSPRPFWGHAYRGLDHVSHLVTLGSPHYNRQKLIYGGWISQWIEKRYPGATFAPEVRYCSVAGKLIFGNPQGTLRERHAHSFYADIGGKGEVWGDGLIPVSSALLKGSEQILLKASHFSGFGGPWYGEEQVVRQWWVKIYQNCYERADPPPTQTSEG